MLFPISLEVRVLSPWYGLFPGRSCMNFFVSLFLVLSRISFLEFQLMPMRTLAEEPGAHISELPRGPHVMDCDPSFLT